LDKNLEDEGWWKGESISTGRVGVFPDNFVEEIVEPAPQQTPANGSAVAKRGGVVKPLPPANQSTPTPIVNNIKSTSSSNMNKNGLHHLNGSITNSSDPSSLTTSSSSNSSSKDSLTRPVEKQNGNHVKQAQLQLQQQQQQQQQQISSSIEDNNSKSQSDISDDLEDIQHTERNKLTHIKKTRQFNKRPPSFRSKSNEGLGDDDLSNRKETSPDKLNKEASPSPAPNKYTPVSPKSSPTNLTKHELNNGLESGKNSSVSTATTQLIDEIAFLSFFRDVSCDAGGVEALSCLVDGIRIKVSRKYLQRVAPWQPRLVLHLLEGNRQ
jgi:hypothetical protein